MSVAKSSLAQSLKIISGCWKTSMRNSMYTLNEKLTALHVSSLPERNHMTSSRSLLGTHIFSMTNLRLLSSESDTQFVQFLEQEIGDEKKDSATLPKISGFNVHTDGSEVKLSKKAGGEIITVEFNVNNTVSAVDDEEDDGGSKQAAEPTPPEMVSNPPFTVTIQKDGHPLKLSVRCEFIDDSLTDERMPEDENDAYQIVEMAMVDSEWNEKTYSVSSELLDGTMYDLLMLMLEERGIGHTDFIDQLIEFSTAYEQSLYVQLLESLTQLLRK